MPRTFTRADLLTITNAEFLAMSHADRAAYDRCWWSCVAEPPVDLSDYDFIGSNRRFEIGE